MKLSNALVAVLSLFISYTSIGQGATVYAGTSSAFSTNSILAPNQNSLSGYHFGADGRLGDNSFYFIISGQYHQLGFPGEKGFSFRVGDNSLDLIKGRTGFAFQVFEISEDINLRLRVLGVLDYFIGKPELQQADLTNPTYFNEAVAGVIGGIELDVFCFTLQAEYEKGFFNSLNKIDGSTIDYFTLNLGINF